MPRFGFEENAMTELHHPDDLLHSALQQVLVAPQLPANFRDNLRNRILQERLLQVELRRQELAREHARVLVQLQRGHVRMQRNTLAMVIGVAFAAGAAAHLALPWLEHTLGVDGAVSLSLLAITLCVAASAGFLPGRSRA